jgi:8-amino-7-oxononanoate synthase
MYNDHFLNKKLNERKQQNAFRQLKLCEGKIDFCSNDYLGIVKNNLLHKLAPANFQLKTGSTGSRLLAGNYKLIEEVEKQIASFHQSETTLIFNSGYDANVGVLSSIPQRGDIILYDFLSHASIRDGTRLSFAQSFPFAHNDLNDLEKKLQQIRSESITAFEKNIFVVTESVFSMDGDICPLQQLAELCKKNSVHLIIDEAHATGVVGESGEGLVQHLHLQDEIFCRVHTFGKACGCHGATVLGSRQLRDYLINFARTFIYSTALPEHAAALIRASYQIFPNMMNERKYLQQLINLFQSANIPYEKLVSQTPIQIVIVPGNDQIKILAEKLQRNNLDVRPILYPTVPKGKERLRIVLHAFNTEREVQLLIEELKN